MLIDKDEDFSVMVGSLKLPVWNDSGRPSGVSGICGGNIDSGKVEWFDGSSWVNADGTPV